MAANPNSTERIDAGIDARGRATHGAVAEVPSASLTHRTLPFAFAKRHGVLIQELRDGTAQAIYKKGAAAQSLAEVRRFAGIPVRFVEVDAETFDARLQTAYDGRGAER